MNELYFDYGEMFRTYTQSAYPIRKDRTLVLVLSNVRSVGS